MHFFIKPSAKTKPPKLTFKKQGFYHELILFHHILRRFFMELVNPENFYHIAKAAAFIGAGICMGLGGLGPALGQGFIGGKACESLGKRPEHVGPIKSTMFQAMIVVETSLIFMFVTSFMLIFMT